MEKILKHKNKILFGIIAVTIVSFFIINVFSAMYLGFSLFKKDGSDGFKEYFYGDLPEIENSWMSGKTEEIRFDNSDGKALKAVKITNEHISHSYIIICHQYGGSPETMGMYAKHFYDLGFNIILPYLRGHGESEYENISLGWNDSEDICSWIDEIIKQDKKARIALFGVSMGANAVAIAAAEDLPQNVRLVIADSCYINAEDLIEEYTKTQTHLFPSITTKFVSVFFENKLGFSLSEADTIASVSEIEMPIMFINGENDTVVPPRLSKKLYENCEAKGVEEVIISEGVHGKNEEADPDKYWSVIDNFILNNLGI